MAILTQIAAASSALVNTTSHTRFSNGLHTFPAFSMAVGKEYAIKATVRVTGVNATPTLRVRCLVGATTLTGTAIADTTAVTAAADDLVVIDLRATVRAISATAGILVASGLVSTVGAAGTATARVAFATVSSLNTEAAILAEITGLWSAAHASNSCQLEQFSVSEHIVGV